MRQLRSLTHDAQNGGKKCPVREIKLRSGWCSKAQSYIIKMNEIIAADKADYPKLIAAMKSALKPPEDVVQLMTTATFLCNKFAKHHIDPTQPILHPTPGKPDSTYWCVV